MQRVCATTSKTHFFFNDTATTEIYTLSLHDALPISDEPGGGGARGLARGADRRPRGLPRGGAGLGGHAPRGRSEEHTSELQSRQYLVCCLLLEKKNISSHFRPPHVFTRAPHLSRFSH